MKSLLNVALGLAFGISSLAAPLAIADQYENLNKSCTQELQKITGTKNPKFILLISQEGDIDYIAPYDVKLSPVSFPFAVSDIAYAPKTITLVPYHSSPLSTMACWSDGMGHIICFK